MTKWNEKSRMRNIAVFLLFFLITIGISITSSKAEEVPQRFLQKHKAVIIEIVEGGDSSLETSGGSYKRRVQNITVKVEDGVYEGQEFFIEHYLDEVQAYNITVEKGDAVYIFFEKDEEGNILKTHIHEVRRDKYLVYLIIMFIVLMILVGGAKGIKSLFTLSLTVVGIYYMLIGIMNGMNPIFISILVSLLVTVVTMFLIAGFNRKAISAIIGTLSGVLVAGILALIMSNIANLTGLGDSEAQMLVNNNYNMKFDIQGILFAAILLGTLGAVMDVCMSISSAINEITEANPLLGTIDLFKSGMNIGRDVMGTMVNTLILAYVGTSVFLILIFMVNQIPATDIINMDMIATEIVRALTGTIGLIVAIPITAIVSAMLEKKSYKLK